MVGVASSCFGRCFVFALLILTIFGLVVPNLSGVPASPCFASLSYHSSFIVPWGTPFLDGNFTPGEWPLTTAINLTFFKEGGVPLKAPSIIHGVLALQYDQEALYVGLVLLNLTISNSTCMLELNVAIDDGVLKDRVDVSSLPWIDRGSIYKRGDIHSIFIKGSFVRRYDDYFVNSSYGYGWAAMGQPNAVFLDETGACFNFTAEGVPGQLGNYSFETNFIYWEVSGRPQDLARASVYHMHIHLWVTTRWQISGDWLHHSVLYCWPLDSYYGGEEVFFPESLFSNWTRVDCPLNGPPPPPDLRWVLLIAVACGVAGAGLLLARWLHNLRQNKRQAQEYWKSRPLG